MSRTNFYDPKEVWAIEVWLYLLFTVDSRYLDLTYLK